MYKHEVDIVRVKALQDVGTCCCRLGCPLLVGADLAGDEHIAAGDAALAQCCCNVSFILAVMHTVEAARWAW